MRRFLISRENITDDIVFIRGQEARHICRTLRLKPGECLHLFDRDGGWYDGRILEISRETISVRVGVRHEADCENGSRITLCLGITKGKLMDYTVQKCTELGVERILPFMSSRCIPRWAPEKVLQKGRHWQAVAEAAVKQSGVRRVPTVEPVIDFTALMQRSFAGCLKVFLWELEHGVTLKTVL
ncbi:MAG: 16S rRNA (uracil(1498)-N(3))-methyltransferase, partial [bacterium]|nr:16S rRNA (uracil(1498)-N(3))-methyltransferase [bacterium]